MTNIKNYFIGILTVMLFTMTGAQAAYDDAGTDYTADTADAWIDMGPSMEPLNFSDFLVCVIKKSGASLVVNGTYIALVNTSKCQTGQSSDKPEIAKLTVVTSRADNSSPQIVTVWFDVDSSQQYIAEATVTEGASSSAPFGSFTFSWVNANDATEKGTMTFTAGTTSSTIKMAKYDTYNGGFFTSMNGSINNDKTTGEVAVAIDANSYALSFNSSNVNIQKNSDAAVCYNRSSLTEYVYGYNIYDQATGAKKALSGPFQCTYDSSGTTKQCYIGPYGAWYEGGETTSITSVTHENGTVYSGITYDPTDDGSNGGTANDGVYITVPSYTFSPPVIFAKADQDSAVVTAMGSNSSFLEYFGEGSLYGLPWQCSLDGGATYVDGSTTGCQTSRQWRPAEKLADGTAITDNGSNVYVTKASQSMKVMATDVGNCSALDLTNTVSDYPALTSGDITDVSVTWSDKPTVTAAPSVIDGVVQ